MLRISARVVLAAYLGLIAWLTLVMFAGNSPDPNLVPFRSMVHDWTVGGRDLLVNFVCNIGVFAPIGLLLPLSSRRPIRGREVVATGFALSVTIEVLQYLSGRRVADVDDVILNTAGALLGYALLAAWRGGAPHPHRACFHTPQTSLVEEAC